MLSMSLRSRRDHDHCFFGGRAPRGAAGSGPSFKSIESASFSVDDLDGGCGADTGTKDMADEHGESSKIDACS